MNCVFELCFNLENVGDRHLVAFRCDWPAMYLTDEGWVSDNATDCLSNPIDVLNFCKKVRPFTGHFSHSEISFYNVISKL